MKQKPKKKQKMRKIKIIAGMFGWGEWRNVYNGRDRT